MESVTHHLIKVGLQHDNVEKLRLAAEASDKDVFNEPINTVGNNFQAKQKLLSRLRTSTDCNICKETPDKKIAEVMMTLEMLHSVITKAHCVLREYIVNTIYYMAGDLSLQWLYKEVSQHPPPHLLLHPAQVLRAGGLQVHGVRPHHHAEEDSEAEDIGRARAPGQLHIRRVITEIQQNLAKTPSLIIEYLISQNGPKMQTEGMRILLVEPGIFKVDSSIEAEMTEDGPAEGEQDVHDDHDEENGDKAIEVDEAGDIFLDNGRGKPRGRRTSRGSQRRPSNPPDRKRVISISGSNRGGGRGQPLQRGGGQQPSPGRRQTLPSDRCIRCGSHRHRHREKLFPICQNCEHGYPLFHDPALCLHAPGAQVEKNESRPVGCTGYKTPDRRSPTSSMRHGFSKNLEYGSLTTERTFPAKN